MPADDLPTLDQPLSDADYHRKASAVLAAVEAQLDRWLQDDVVDIDARRTGGLLELVFPDRSHIVINMQPPLHELWLAAREGGFHYRHDGARWIDGRSGDELFAALSRLVSAQGGQAVVLAPR